MRELNELAKKYKTGEISNTEIDRLYKEVKRIIYNFMWNKTQTKSVCDEISESTVFKAFYKFSQYDPNYCFSTWIHTIAINEYKLKYRRDKQYPVYHFSQDGVDVGGGMNRSIVEEVYITTSKIADYQDPHVLLEVKEKDEVQHQLYQRVTTTLSSFKEEHSTAFLDYMDGYKYEEIEEATGINRNTLKTRVRAVKTKLIKSLSPLYEILSDY